MTDVIHHLSNRMRDHRSFDPIFTALIFATGALMANPTLFLSNALYGSEDLLAYYQWTREFGEAIQQGFIRPHWDPSGMEGLGAPAFIFCPPFFFYATSLLMLAGLDAWSSMRVMVFLSWWALGLMVWLLLRRRVSVLWALGAGLAMQASPLLFHAISLHNLFPFAISVIPLTWLIVASVEQRPANFSSSVAFSLALLVITHQLVGFMALISLPAIFIPSLIKKTPGTWPRIFAWSLSCVAGLLMSSFYLYTAMTSLPLIQTDDWFEPFHCDWRNSFITPVVTHFIYGMRWFSIQWGIGGLALLLLMTSVFLMRKATPNADREIARGMNRGLVWAGFAAFFFASECSYLVWKYAPMIGMVQWPYRFLAVLMPLAILALVIAGAHATRRWEKIIAAALLAALPVMNVLLQLKNNPTLTRPVFSSMNANKYYCRPADTGPKWQEYIAAGGLDGECIRNHVKLVENSPRSESFAWTFNAEYATRLTLPVMNFPAWVLSVNDQVVDIEYEPSTGLITVPLPQGVSEVTLMWETLPNERTGQVMTLAGLALTGVMLARSTRRIKE